MAGVIVRVFTSICSATSPAFNSKSYSLKYYHEKYHFN
jgi:hypothetical protein